MDAPLPLSREVRERTPAEVVRSLVQLCDRIERPEAGNCDLRNRLGLKGSNTSKPPSTDPPVPPSDCSRDSQPGHPRHDRRLALPEQVHEKVPPSSLPTSV